MTGERFGEPRLGGSCRHATLERLHLLPRWNVGARRARRVIDTPELVVTGTPYLVPCTVVDNAVVALRVLHKTQ